MKKLSTLFALGLLMIVVPGVASAIPLPGALDPADADTSVEYIPPSLPDNSVAIAEPQDLIDVIVTVIGWAQVFFWVLAVIMGLYAAFLYLTSTGDPGRISRANSTIIWTAVAVGAAVISYALPIVVAALFGADQA